MIPNIVKYRVIYHYKNKYTVKNMCKFFQVSGSAYYEWGGKKNNKDKNLEITTMIHIGYEKSHKTYGYRRIQIWLFKEYGIKVNQKKVKRIMKKENIQSIARRNLKYKRYSGQIYKYDNVMNREFKADSPNKKWVTDIRECK